MVVLTSALVTSALVYSLKLLVLALGIFSAIGFGTMPVQNRK